MTWPDASFHCGLIPACRAIRPDRSIHSAKRSVSSCGVLDTASDPMLRSFSRMSPAASVRAIAAADHPLASRKAVSLADLSQERWGLPQSSPLTQQRLRRISLEHGLPPPDVAVETRSARLRLQLVASSNLLEYTSRNLFQSARRRFHLKARPIKALAWRRPVSVVYREGVYLSPAARQLIARIKAAVAMRTR